jgi:replicative DNA helicase Mcm
LIELFEEFFKSHYSKEAEKLASEWPHSKSLECDYAVLAKYYARELADPLLENPELLLEDARTALKNLFREVDGFNPHVRFYNLPEQAAVMVMNLGAEHAGKLIRIDGIVNLITEINPMIKVGLWECVGQGCNTRVKFPPVKGVLVPPSKDCACGKRFYKLNEAESEFVNLQRADLMDPVEKMRGAVPAAKVQLWLEDDLVNKIAPGDKISIAGVPAIQERRIGKSKSSVYSKYVQVLSCQKQEVEFEEIEVTQDEEQEFKKLSKDPQLFEKVGKSIAPMIYGYAEMKQAIALQLFGGTPDKMTPEGQTMRSDIHALVVGDPGTAKSRILQFASLLAPKCIYVSGAAATGVGLTASAEKDELTGGWVLKAGALVLASGGMAAIDEFDKMQDNERGAIHEALEQQSVSIAKAGIVTKFKTQTAVLAAANPKLGRFDSNQPIATQFDIPPTLLSRFDLIFSIRDILDDTKDKKTAEHILKGHKAAARGKALEDEEEILPEIPINKLRKYIAFARRSVKPRLSEEAGGRIQNYYVELRRLGAKQNTFPITARQIEGLIRLSEASAKARLSESVELQDAERAIALMNHVLNEVFMDKETGKFDSDLINLGQSKTKVDRMRTVLEVIRDLEGRMDAVPIEDVVREASKAGVDESYVNNLIEQLKKTGELYSPKHGIVKIASRRGW